MSRECAGDRQERRMRSWLTHNWATERESRKVQSQDSLRRGKKKKKRNFPGGASGKEPPANAGDIRDMGLIPGSGRSPGGGHGNPLQSSCLEKPMNRRDWWTIVHGVTKSQTRLK